MPKIVALGLLLTALLAAPARGELPVLIDVRYAGLSDDFSILRQFSQYGAVGLLVPDAGPQTSYMRAYQALQRGKVTNSLLEKAPEGPVLIRPRPVRHFRSRVPGIDLALPTRELQPNDRRYPIVVYAPGYRGLLTSESTRIPGLVSIVDVAPTALDHEGKLGWVAHDDPYGALLDLDRRIREHREAKTPILLLSLTLLVALAIFWRKALVPGFAAILLANLLLGITGWTDEWGVIVLIGLVAASLLFARLALVAHGLLLAGVLVAYLLAMGIDERWVALSPLGPTQNARFYGLSNLLATLLLVPALGGAALLGRAFGMWAFGAVAGLALVTVGGSQFGADGGGVIVLLAAYGVLLLAEFGLSKRTLALAASVVAVLALALALGQSHVTDALADGPSGLAEDFWRRLELSWLRATSGWGVGLLVGAGIVALVAVAWLDRRPLVTAYLAAIAVSLVVNDSPNDVILAGLAGYLVLSTAPGVARPAGERARSAASGSRAQSVPAASP